MLSGTAPVQSQLLIVNANSFSLPVDCGFSVSVSKTGAITVRVKEPKAEKPPKLAKTESALPISIAGKNWQIANDIVVFLQRGNGDWVTRPQVATGIGYDLGKKQSNAARSLFRRIVYALKEKNIIECNGTYVRLARLSPKVGEMITVADELGNDVSFQMAKEVIT